MIDVEKLEALHRKHLLSGKLPLQAETITLHYLSLFSVINQLHLLVEEYKRHGTDELLECIEYSVNNIKAKHLKDFGIELEWEKDKCENGLLKVVDIVADNKDEEITRLRKALEHIKEFGRVNAGCGYTCSKMAEKALEIK